MTYILIHLGKKINTFKGLILSNQKHKTYGKPTLRLVLLVFFMVVVVVTTGVGVIFRLSSYIRNLSEMEKSCVVLMERSQECENVILVPPLQFNEGVFVLTHTASFTPRSYLFFSLSKMVTSFTST